MNRSPNILIILLRCGAFLLFPTATFGFGIWLMNRYIRRYEKFTYFAFAVLWSIIAFELTILGLLFDSRTNSMSWASLLTVSGLTGFGTLLLVLVLLPLATKLMRFLRNLNQPK